jgi:hypothetical protein
MTRGSPPLPEALTEDRPMAALAPKPLRARLRRDARALLVFLLAYAFTSYLLLPAWWRHHERPVAWEEMPKRTHTSVGLPGDPLNVALVGSAEEVGRTLRAAGWYPADPTTWRSSLHITTSVLLNRPYPEAPVSNLYLWGRRQDLVFQRAAGKSARRRHHVRFWLAPEHAEGGRPLWLGAATFDRSVGVSHYTGQVTHHIEADVDRERDQLVADLQGAGRVERTYAVEGLGPTARGRNGGGDRYFTDGRIVVAVLSEAPPSPGATPQPPEGGTTNRGSS